MVAHPVGGAVPECRAGRIDVLFSTKFSVDVPELFAALPVRSVMAT